MLKIGIIGEENGVAAYAKAVTNSRLAQVVKIHCESDDPSGSSPTTLPLRFGARPATCADEILSDKTIDGIVIASSGTALSEILHQAAATGKHILSVPPTTWTTEQLGNVDTIADAFDSASTTLMAARPWRYASEFRNLKESLSGPGAETGIGTIGMIRLGHLRSPMPEGSVEPRLLGAAASVSDQLAMLVDLLRFVGGEISRIRVMHAPPSDQERRSGYALAIACLDSGARAHLEASSGESGSPPRSYFEVAGSNGLLEFNSAAAPKLSLQGKPDPVTGSTNHAPGWVSTNPELTTPCDLVVANFLATAWAPGAPGSAESFRDAMHALRLLHQAAELPTLQSA